VSVRLASIGKAKPPAARSSNAFRAASWKPRSLAINAIPGRHAASRGFSSMKRRNIGATSARRPCSRRIVNICTPYTPAAIALLYAGPASNARSAKPSASASSPQRIAHIARADVPIDGRFFVLFEAVAMPRQQGLERLAITHFEGGGDCVRERISDQFGVADL